nr:hypothetical protein [uncultured Desulfobacter sp.]
MSQNDLVKNFGIAEIPQILNDGVFIFVIERISNIINDEKRFLIGQLSGFDLKNIIEEIV